MLELLRHGQPFDPIGLFYSSFCGGTQQLNLSSPNSPSSSRIVTLFEAIGCLLLRRTSIFLCFMLMALTSSLCKLYSFSDDEYINSVGPFTLFLLECICYLIVISKVISRIILRIILRSKTQGACTFNKKRTPPT